MPFLPLLTPRLLLRPFTEADDQNIFDLDSDREVTRHVNGGQPPDRERIRSQIIPRFLEFQRCGDGLGFFAAEERASSQFIGWFHFRPKRGAPEIVELGYRLKRCAWGKGYATEGSRALLEHGFSVLGVQHVEATALTANPASIRVLQKCGLRFVEEYVDADFPGGPQRAVRYALTATEWETMPRSIPLPR